MKTSARQIGPHSKFLYGVARDRVGSMCGCGETSAEIWEDAGSLLALCLRCRFERYGATAAEQRTEREANRSRQMHFFSPEPKNRGHQ